MNNLNKFLSALAVLISLDGCSNKIDKKDIKDVDLSVCIDKELSVLPSLYNGMIKDNMKIVLEKESNNIDCYVKELGLSKSSNKLYAVQRIHDFITIKQDYKEDSPTDHGIKYLSRYIKDKNGDCEDKAMFALAIMKRLDINPYVVDIDKKDGSIGHVALALTDDFIINNIEYKNHLGKVSRKNSNNEETIIPFDPIDGDNKSYKIGAGGTFNKYSTQENKGEYIFKYFKVN